MHKLMAGRYHSRARTLRAAPAGRAPDRAACSTAPTALWLPTSASISKPMNWNPPRALLDRLRSSESDPAAARVISSTACSMRTPVSSAIPRAMNALTRQVLPQLFARKSDEVPGTLRIWSAGCATGEEALLDRHGPVARRSWQAADGSSNGNGIERNANGSKDAAGNTGIPQRWHRRKFRLRQHLVQRLVDPHRRQRPSALRDPDRRARPLSAIGAGGSASGHHPRLLFQNRLGKRRTKVQCARHRNGSRETDRTERIDAMDSKGGSRKRSRRNRSAHRRICW